MSEDIQGWSGHCREAATGTIEEYPLSTTLGMFAVGLSIGVLVGASLASPSRSHGRHVAESLGRRMLDALQDYVPESVHQYLHG
jgi:hypothetical protein